MWTADHKSAAASMPHLQKVRESVVPAEQTMPRIIVGFILVVFYKSSSVKAQNSEAL